MVDKVFTEKEAKELQPQINRLRFLLSGIPEEKHKDVSFMQTVVFWRVTAKGGFNPLHIRGLFE